MKQDKEAKALKKARRLQAEQAASKDQKRLQEMLAKDPPRDIFKILQEEIDQEKRDFQLRLERGGLDALQKEERERYDIEKEMKEEQAKLDKDVTVLMTENLHDIDSKQFEGYKKDDNLMDSWAKKMIEIVWHDEHDSPLIAIVKDLMKIMDKELYLQARERKITIRQFKTRCMEKLNGNQFKFIDYDDVVHLIHPDCQNLDLKKVDKWCMAVYGKHMDQLPLRGPDAFTENLEDWMVQPRCLKSIANFFMTEKRTESQKPLPGEKVRSIPVHREWDFQKTTKKKLSKKDEDEDNTSLNPYVQTTVMSKAGTNARGNSEEKPSQPE